MLKVTNEKKCGHINTMITSYYMQGSGRYNSLDTAHIEMVGYFKDRPETVGRGGSHIWLKNSDDERILIITEI